MAFDAHKNLAIATVATAPTPASSGTALTVTAGTGARFPAAPFQATVWAPTTLPAPPTAEVVRVTARTGDTLTIVRAQEGTLARAIVPGDAIAATITVKAFTDLESGLNFPLITTPGTVKAPVFRGSPTLTLATDTNDGADNVFLTICGGGAAEATRGAFFLVGGNESVVTGQLRIVAGNTPTGRIEFFTGPELVRGAIHPSGGFAWGGVPDPGAGNIGAVAFVTGSDARLKTDRGRHTDPDVLRRTIIHDFTWTADGTPGRGVFAQEAAVVAPFAVSVGTDDRDESGNLKQPWGVDYSKYVPDLITGWQAHDAEIAGLTARLAAIDHGYVTIRLPRPTSGTLFQSIRTTMRMWWATVQGRVDRWIWA